MVASPVRFDMVEKTQALIDAMREAAISAYPNEGCGLVVGIGKKTKLITCANISTTPAQTFMISPSDYRDAQKAYSILGVWHSHVDESNNPSPADMTGCEATDMPWFITSIYGPVSSNPVTDTIMFSPTGYEIDYLGRPYVLGTLDCYSLMLDYYKREFGVSLTDYARVSEAGTVNYDFFLSQAEHEGFVRQTEVEPKVGDIFLIQVGSVSPNHIAIYLGGDTILHHMNGRLSKRDIYGGYYQKHTSHHYRHLKNVD